MANRVRVALLILAVLASAEAATAGPLDHPGYTKAVTCSACHGFAGASPSDAVPILAGMNAAYMKKALADYAAGTRVSPEMEPYAKMAMALGVDDVVSYFASQKKAVTPLAADPEAIARGRLASAPCVSCHGGGGQGDPSRLVPALAGQPAGYLRAQLLLFKADRRSPGDEPLKAVKAMLNTIPDQTLADLAAYYSSLR